MTPMPSRASLPTPTVALVHPPVRALFIHSGNLFGGVETAMISLARTAHEHGTSLEPSFALCFDDGRVAKELRAAGAVVHGIGTVRMSRPWQIHRVRARLRQLLESHHVDICVMPSSWIHALFAPVVRACGLPIALWANDRWSRDRWMDRLALRHTPNVVIANSRYTADGMAAAVPGVPVRLVYYGIAASPIDRTRRREIRAELDTPDDALVVVQVGRLDPYKGHRMLIEAVARLPRSIDWRCWLIGGADTPLQRRYLAELQQAAVNAGVRDRIRFAGARYDIGSVLAAADIFCHPNLSPEAFGIVFIEALRAGLPVIGSATGGVLDIVTPECGRLVPAGDVTALTEALTELALSPPLRQALASRGPERASTLCDVGSRVNDLAATLRAFIGEGPHASPQRSAGSPS